MQHQYESKNDVPPEIWKQTIDAIEATQHLKEFHEQVVNAGGLHVIGTERHEAIRIDRQLAGRAGRQGDPGSCQFYLSLEDELLEGLGTRKKEIMESYGQRLEDKGDHAWRKYQPLFLKAQQRIERRHFRQRVDLVVYERNRQEILKDLGADPYVD